MLQFAETRITPPPLAPLGSAQAADESPLQPWPAPVMPTGLLALNVIAGGSPTGAGMGSVPLGVGVPGTNCVFGTTGAAWFTSLSMRGGWGGYFTSVNLLRWNVGLSNVAGAGRCRRHEDISVKPEMAGAGLSVVAPIGTLQHEFVLLAHSERFALEVSLKVLTAIAGNVADGDRQRCARRCGRQLGADRWLRW